MSKSFINANGVEVKRCTTCKQAKPVSEFYKDRSKPDGHTYDCKACRKVYYEVNRDVRLAYQKEYEQTAKGREVRRKVGSKRRTLKLGAIVGDVNGAAVYERSGHVCIYCGATTDLTLDHIVPLVRGGAHSEENLVVACRRCNSSKSDKPLVQWLQTQPKAVAWIV